MAILEKIVLENFSAGGECNLFHHGVVRDFIDKRCFEFHKGNFYGIIGEFGYGGAALSCGITGKTNFYEGRISIDNKEVSIEYLKQNSWYVGNDLYKYKTKDLFGSSPKIMKNTIKEQIEQGIRNGNHELDFHMIQNIFGISDERVGRNIEYVSGERWKASVAIGYANGKKIFCYPWMNSKDINHFGEQLSSTVKSLLDFGCIVILPTTKQENIKKINCYGNIVLL